MNTTEPKGGWTKISAKSNPKPAEIFIKRIEAGLIYFREKFFD